MGEFSVDHEISSSVDSLNAQLFSSLIGGQEALKAFMYNWINFEDRFRGLCDILHRNTVQKVDAFASMVAAVVSSVSNTHKAFEQISCEAGTGIDEALAIGETKSTPSHAPYIKLASQWLVGNIHNPYPSSETRDEIAKSSGSSRRDVDNWFLDARRRIGWNDLRKSQFSNKRADIVDAATRFFLDTDPSRPLPLMLENAFAHIQNRVKELFSNKFQESHLAVKLNKSVNMPPSREKSLGHRTAPSGSKPSCSYPTPQPSPCGSLSHSTPSPSPSVLELPPTSRKRKASLASMPKADTRLPKRRRSSVVDGNRSPSPELGRNSHCVPPKVNQPSPIPSTFEEVEPRPPRHSPAPTHKRKRRPSGSEALPSPKRPRDSSGSGFGTSLPGCCERRSESQGPLTAGVEPTSGSSRLPTVSNALPMSLPTADEFNWDQLLDFSTLPPPVSLLSPDDIAGPIDVSLFDFPSWEQYECGSLNLFPSEEPIITSSSSSTVHMGAIHDFPTQLTDPLAEDSPLFDWNACGSSDPECLEDLLSTKISGIYNLPNISSDFAPLPDQWSAPIALTEANGCFQTFADPTPTTSQEVLALAVPKPTITLSEFEREAKEERLRVLKAEMATLTAEIATGS